jgi:hypothetical protein
LPAGLPWLRPVDALAYLWRRLPKFIYKDFNLFNNIINRSSIYRFEAIVRATISLANLKEQAGGLQEKGTRFHEKFISA